MSSAFSGKPALPYILAIDTSCDDTSAAVTQGVFALSNVVASQAQLHKQYGGVFPTVAKQAHKENITPVIKAALQRAGVPMENIGAVAVTQGPGLAPALEIGIDAAKALSLDHKIPLIVVNHIEGHALSALVQPLPKKLSSNATSLEELSYSQLESIQFPFLSVVVSGKHTDFILTRKFGEYERVGFTVDDAAGEALDKFGRMVDLGYPAGPLIEEFARKGDAHRFAFPLPMTTSGNFNMSFSGMKTSARNLVEKLEQEAGLTQQDIYNLCASFQTAVFKAITYKMAKFLHANAVSSVWLGGGVAANVALRSALRQTIKPYGIPLRTPYTKRLCIDNAAMIGVVAGSKWQRGEAISGAADIEKIERLPRWHVGD